MFLKKTRFTSTRTNDRTVRYPQRRAQTVRNMVIGGNQQKAIVARESPGYDILLAVLNPQLWTGAIIHHIHSPGMDCTGKTAGRQATFFLNSLGWMR